VVSGQLVVVSLVSVKRVSRSSSSFVVDWGWRQFARMEEGLNAPN
jgi:hypothetical protein